MKRELDMSTRPVPRRGDTLDAYLDRYLTWLENEVVAIVNDRMRRNERRAARKTITVEKAFKLAGIDYDEAKQGRYTPLIADRDSPP